MSNEEKEIIRKSILDKIVFVQEDIVEFKIFTQPVSPDDAIGRISRIDAIMNNSVTEGALREAESKLQRLELALSMIDREEFGICKKCKIEIPFARMKVMPESVYCVKCGK